MPFSNTAITCQYFEQACSNEKFLIELEKNNPNDFFDWKTTVVFYTSLHLIKSYAKTQNVTLDDHGDTFKKIYSQGSGLKPDLKLDSQVVSSYTKLFKLAHTTRYAGYARQDVSGKIGKLRLKDAQQYLEIIKAWIIPKILDFYQFEEE